MEFLTRRLEQLLWPASETDGKPPGRWRTFARYSFALVRDLLRGELSLRAMSLVYTTMLAVVPLLAFGFAVLKGLEFHRQLEPLLNNFFAPLGDRAEELTSRVMGFVDNVSGSTLAGVSIGLLLYTALSMAQKVETSFNFVWRVDRPRSLARRLSEYLSVMFVGPLIMSIALGAIATLANTAVVNRLQTMEPLGTWLARVGGLIPYVLVIGAFTFLYVFVPNTRVRFKPALVGGVLAGILWAGGGTLFASFVASASRTEIIYSGFAIVIVAMLWTYLSWLILLLGAQLAFYVQYPEHVRLGHATEQISNGLRERLALGTMLLVATAHTEAEDGVTEENVASRLRVSRHVLEPVVSALIEAKLLTHAADLRLLPGKDVRKIDVLSILNAVRASPHDRYAAPLDDWHPLVRSLGRQIDRAIEDALGGRTLADLVDAAQVADRQPGDTEAASATAPQS
jgi:membrane protein